MLVLPENMSDLRSELREVLMELRRGHVSRFPIHVKAYSTTMRFYDSRFMGGTDVDDALVAKFGVDTHDKGHFVYTVFAHTIENDKYRCGSQDFHTKQSRDPKKMLRVLREHVKPLSAPRVASLSRRNFHSRLTDWHQSLRSTYRRTTEAIDLDGIVEELIMLQQMGFKPQTAKLSRLMDDAVPAYQEMKRVKERSTIRVHILINPDGSVSVSDWDDKTVSVESMEKTHKNVQEQVAILRMMDAGAFVPEVGMKVNENQYWVDVDKNTLS